MAATTLTFDLDVIARNIRMQLDSARARLVAIKSEDINRLDSASIVFAALAYCDMMLVGLRPDDINNQERFRSLYNEANKLATAYRTEIEVTVRNGRDHSPSTTVRIIAPTQAAPVSVTPQPQRRKRGGGGDRSKRHAVTTKNGKPRLYISNEDVKAIRKYLDDTCGGDCAHEALEEVAAMYGCSASTVWKIYRRVTFKNL